MQLWVNKLGKDVTVVAVFINQRKLKEIHETTNRKINMKFKRTLIMGVAMAIFGFAAMAQDRVYTRVNGQFHGEFKFWDSKDELGVRFISYVGQDPCNKGFMKLAKSVQSGAIVFTTDKKMPGCPNHQYIFPDGDLSIGYWATASIGGEFLPVNEAIAALKARPQGATPLILKK